MVFVAFDKATELVQICPIHHVFTLVEGYQGFLSLLKASIAFFIVAPVYRDCCRSCRSPMTLLLLLMVNGIPTSCSLEMIMHCLGTLSQHNSVGLPCYFFLLDHVVGVLLEGSFHNSMMAILAPLGGGVIAGSTNTLNTRVSGSMAIRNLPAPL